MLMLMLLSRAAPASWPAALIGCWLLPVRLVVVLTGLAVAGTVAAAVHANHDEERALLITALADASRPHADRLQRQVQPATSARLGSLRAGR